MGGRAGILKKSEAARASEEEEEEEKSVYVGCKNYIQNYIQIPS